MNYSFANRVALITGAGNGIGRQFARALAREGAHIAAIDREPESLAGLEQELKGSKCTCAEADVTDAAALNHAVNRLEEKLGCVDLLIANAGILRFTPASNFQATEFAAQIKVNLIGVANSMAAVMPGMRARQRGHLVAISSVAAFRGVPPLAGYCASKAGVNSLCEALRVELRQFGIAVTTICPDRIESNIARDLELKNPPPMLLTVEDAVNRMINAIRNRRPLYTLPTMSAWQARLIRFSPRFISDWLSWRISQRINNWLG